MLWRHQLSLGNLRTPEEKLADADILREMIAVAAE
jgi:hypothetical protein